MLAYGLWQMYYGPVYAAIQDMVPPELRATAMVAYFLACIFSAALSDRCWSER